MPELCQELPSSIQGSGSDVIVSEASELRCVRSANEGEACVAGSSCACGCAGRLAGGGLVMCLDEPRVCT
jgi:hypothetical protein